MNYFINRLLVWSLFVSTVLLSEAAPKIILKFDDLGIKNNVISAKTVMDLLKNRNIKASFGLIANRSDNTGKATLTPYINAKYTNGDPLFEFWHHGYDHVDPEFSGQPYQYQKTHFEDADKLVNTLFGIQMHSFGAPFNASDANTSQVISENSNYKVAMFGPSPSSGAGFMNLTNRVNLETATGVPNYSAFVTNYNARKNSFTDYMVIQAHPNGYSTTEIFELTQMLDFLIKEGCEFVTPYKYYLSLQPSNIKPVISFQSPIANAIFPEYTSIKVTVNASDQDGTVSKVDLYIDNIFISTMQTAPYTWNQNSDEPKLKNLLIGTYTLKAIVTDNQNATNQALTTFTINKVTGIAPNGEMASVSIYPNPTNNEFQIQSNEKIVKISVYDLNGKELIKTTDTRESFGKDWIPGIYFIKLENEEGKVFVKRIEKRSY